MLLEPAPAARTMEEIGRSHNRGEAGGGKAPDLAENNVSSDLAPITTTDLADAGELGAALLALNNAYELELSGLKIDRLRHLVAQAFVARRIGHAEAFLIAVDQDADYDSPNFLWFRARFQRFVYVDRIVVASRARGRGHARRLYRDLFIHAAQAGHDRIVCEVNSVPPNPESHAFHASLGFTEIGSGSIRGSSKTVRYLLYDLARVSPNAV